MITSIDLSQEMFWLTPGFHICRKDRKHGLENIFFYAVQLWLGLHMIVIITSIDVLQEIFWLRIASIGLRTCFKLSSYGLVFI